MDKIRIEISKNNVFETDYIKEDMESVKNMVSQYLAFFNSYREAHHGISARMWRFPVVEINGHALYRVTPNGRWDEIKGDNK